MTISEKLRQQVIVEADYRCEYCKTSSRLTGTPPVIEHILPRSLGGNGIHQWMTKLIDGSDRIPTSQVQKCDCASSTSTSIVDNSSKAIA